MDQKNCEIQLLRVIAIVLVLMMHAPLGMPHPFVDKYCVILSLIHPAVGVDIFFVISGYLMGVTFLDRTEWFTDIQDKIELTARFYLRRFWRLFPAAVFWITVTLVIGLISGDHEIWLEPLVLYKAWISSIINFRNFEDAIRQTHLGYYWSLSMENQFYFLLPLAWFFTPRKWFWKSVLLLCIAAIFWRPGGERWWHFRYDGLLMGLMLYRLCRLEAFRNALRLLSPESVAGKVAMLFLLSFFIPAVPISLGDYPSLTWSIVALLSTYLVAQAVLNEGRIYIPSAFKAPVYWFGEISYSVYLCHLPVWMVFKDLVKHHVDPVTEPHLIIFAGVFSLVSIFLCATLTYLFIEKPCQLIGFRKLQKFAGRVK